MLLVAVISCGIVFAATLDTFTLSPATITPNGDTVDDEATITVEFNESIDYNIEILDGSTVVKALVADTGTSDSVTWNGKDSSNDLVAEGDYIVNVSWASGVESAFKTITVDLPET